MQLSVWLVESWVPSKQGDNEISAVFQSNRTLRQNEELAPYFSEWPSSWGSLTLEGTEANCLDFGEVAAIEKMRWEENVVFRSVGIPR